MGYSLGGRLALHALLDSPQLWSGAIIISSHPGLETAQQRQDRKKNDSIWAERFLDESWDSLMHAWNQQEVFKSSNLLREEKDYSRQILADTLIHWSLAEQENLKTHIEKLNIPILWVAGESDKRYAAIAKSLQLHHHQSRVWIAKELGHRVPWEATADFQKQIQIFLEALL